MTAPTPARIVLRADDPIEKFQGRWIGAQGWQFPVHARYVAWGIFAIVFPAILLADWALTGAVSALPLIDLTLAVAITYGLANLTTGEVSLSHVLVYLGRTARAARPHRAPRSAPRTDRVRARIHPEPQRSDFTPGEKQ